MSLGRGVVRIIMGVVTLLALTLGFALAINVGTRVSDTILALGLAHCAISLFFLGIPRPDSSGVSWVMIVYVLMDTARGAIVPTILFWHGQDSPKYRLLASDAEAERTMFIGLIFYVAVLGWWLLLSPRGGGACEQTESLVKEDVPSIAEAWGGRRAGLILIAIGIVSLFLRFPTAGHIQSFLMSADADSLATTGGAAMGGISGLISALGRPLLPLGCGILIACWTGTGVRRLALWALWALVAFISLGSFGLNRATLLIPTAAFLVTYCRLSSIRVSWTHAIGVVVASALAFQAIGSWRAVAFSSRGGVPVKSTWLNDLIQTFLLYAQSPYQAGITLGTGTWSMSTMVASLLGPIPGLGDSWREQTGTAIYNDLIYGSLAVRDQILPSWLEIFLTSGYAGVVVAAGVVALVFRWACRVQQCAKNGISLYASMLLALILPQLSISSISAVVQMLIYMVLAPLVLGTLLRSEERNRPSKESLLTTRRETNSSMVRGTIRLGRTRYGSAFVRDGRESGAAL